jgi:hypothetical protein
VILTCKGREFAHVGVTIGPALQYRDGRVAVDHTERASTDHLLWEINTIADEDPDVDVSALLAGTDVRLDPLITS